MAIKNKFVSSKGYFFTHKKQFNLLNICAYSLCNNECKKIKLSTYNFLLSH